MDENNQFDTDFLETETLVLTTDFERQEPLTAELPFAYNQAENQILLLVEADTEDDLPVWAKHLMDHPECELQISSIDYSAHAYFDEIPVDRVYDAFVDKYGQEQVDLWFPEDKYIAIQVNLEDNPLTDTDADLDQS